MRVSFHENYKASKLLINEGEDRKKKTGKEGRDLTENQR